MNHTEKRGNLALFIDIENLIVGVVKAGFPIDIGLVIKKLLETFSDSTIRMQRTHGDIYAAVRQLQKLVGEEKLKDLHWQVRKNLVESLVHIVDIPYCQSKNSADMSLTVDALSIAYTSPGIDRFVILSSDRDYIPLILKLRELGKEVIGFGISHEVSHLYVKACDAFYYYSELPVAGMAAGQNGGNGVRQHAASTRNAYLRLLIEATTMLNQQGKPAQGSQLVTLMKQLCPHYDPSHAELKSSKHLALIAQREGLVRCHNAGMDFVVTLAQSAEVQPVRGPAIDPMDLESCVVAYRGYFQRKLGIDAIPDAHMRGMIWTISDAILEEYGSIDLSDLSHRVAESIDPALAPQKCIFKLLYGLYRQRAFACGASATPFPFNPRLTGRLIKSAKWDESFVKNCIHMLAQEKPDWPVHEVALAEVFDLNTKQIEEILGGAPLAAQPPASWVKESA